MSFKDRMKMMFQARKEVPLPLYHPDAKLPPGASLPEQLETLQKLRLTGNLPVLSDIASDSPSTSSSSSSKVPEMAPKKKWIAICLVIVDDLYHEEIWKRWVEDGERSQKYCARLFIHAKYPDKISSPWVKAHTLTHSFLPEWNSPEVVRAILAVLTVAIEFRDESTNEACHRFITATESCIPIRSVDETGDLLFASDKSWLNAYQQGNNRWEIAHCFQSVDKSIIPLQLVWKSLPGWIALTRKHVAETLALVKLVNQVLEPQGRDVVSAFGPGGAWDKVRTGVYAPEEVFFPTMLSILGYLKASGNDQVSRTAAVHAEWERASNPNPIAFPALSEKLVTNFQNSGALLARKFRKNTVDVSLWQRLILHVEEDPIPVVEVKLDDPKCDLKEEEHASKRRKLD